MDRTLVESQQLDVLFEQMLANRRQTMEQSTSSVGTAEGYGIASSSGVPVDSHGREPVASSGGNMEYADECSEFCEVAKLPWKGKVVRFVRASLISFFVCKATCAFLYGFPFVPNIILCFYCIYCIFLDVYTAALGRCPCDCAICMLPIGQATAATMNPVTSNNSRRDVVLSCSHIFHEKCIGNFERFLSDTVRVPLTVHF